MTGDGGGTDKSAGVVRTIAREEVLLDGSDAAFRELVNDLLLLSKQMQTLRAEMADQLGVSEPQYRVFTTVLLLEGESGVSVSSVANALHVTGAFVTAEAGKLMRLGMLDKAVDENDRRSVLLSASARGRAKFNGFAKSLQTINDELLRDFTREEFVFFSGLVRRVVTNASRASLLAMALPTRLSELGGSPHAEKQPDEIADLEGSAADFAGRS